MNPPSSKLQSADDLLSAVSAYHIFGIDLSKYNMPLVSPPSGPQDRGGISYDPTSCGWFIISQLQPALRNVVAALVLKQTAPFFDSGLAAAKQHLGSSLISLAAQSTHSKDKEGISSLVETLQQAGFERQFTCIDVLVDSVCAALNNKITLAAAEHAAARRVR